MTLVFSLIGGLLIAVAVQLVFANLGIALGLTVLDWSPKQLNQDVLEEREIDTAAQAASFSTQSSNLESSDPEVSERALPITHFVGFGVALGFSAVIFIATLLSVEFSALLDPRRGIIFGLIFWATYWLLFIWLSSTTIAGIADSLLGTALKGGSQLVSTIKEAVDKPNAQQQSEAKPPSAEQSMLKELIAEVSQLAEVQQGLPTLLENQREALLEEICDRTNLSTEEAETIVKELEPPAPISTPTPAPTPIPTPAPTAGLMSQLDLPSWQQILRRTLNKVDLSDWDIETLWQQLPTESEPVQYVKAQFVDAPTAVFSETASSDKQQNSEKAKQRIQPLTQPVTQPQSERQPAAVKAIQSKIIAYCRYTNVDALTPEKLIEKVATQREEHNLDSDSAFAEVASTLDTDAIESVLSRRNNLETAQKEQLMDALETAWPENGNDHTDPLSVHSIVEKAYQALESQFQSIDWSNASLEDIKPEVNLVLEQLEREGTLRSLDWSALSSRIHLPATAQAEFTAWLQTAWLAKVRSLRPAITQTSQNLSQQLADQITHYLHHQKKSELEPARIAKHLTHSIGNAIAALPHPSELIDSELLDSDNWNKQLWDKEAWQQALKNRKDLTAEEIQQILAWGERVWQPKAQQIGRWIQTAGAEVSKHLTLPTTGDLSEKVSDIGLPETNPLVEARQKIVDQIELAQEKVIERAIAVKADLQTQANAARRQVAIAAWWLFIALITSGSAAASAGWLATRY
ncbi:MAG: hypothetical protein ACFB16_05345 [Phormidesmis sp.]